MLFLMGLNEEGIQAHQKFYGLIDANLVIAAIKDMEGVRACCAREWSLHTTLRIFVLDSMAFENIQRQKAVARPDIIEILPGFIPKIIKGVCKLVKASVIEGGIIFHKEEALVALLAGAISVSTTNPQVCLI